MKWIEIVNELVEVRRNRAYAEFKTFRTKGAEMEKWEQKALELQNRENELVQMKIDYVI